MSQRNLILLGLVLLVAVVLFKKGAFDGLFAGKMESPDSRVGAAPSSSLNTKPQVVTEGSQGGTSQSIVDAGAVADLASKFADIFNKLTEPFVTNEK